MSVRLRELLPDQPGVPDLEIAGLALDSRQVASGDLFIALRGERHDGHAHAPEAARRGAAAVLAERPVSGLAVPVVVVADLRDRLGALAARFYGEPGRDLYCIGVTGTNGKTSIAHYLADLAGRLGRPAGYIGTIGWGRVGALEPVALTTPDAITVQRQLAGLRDRGCRWAVLEASSHALAQDRVREVPFRAAVFSNLTRDHLDYHGDMAAYGAAKARLFGWPGLELAVINADDAFGRALAGAVAPDVRVLYYSGAHPGDAACGAVRIGWSDLAFDADGATGRWLTPWGEQPFRLPVHAEFSVANVAAALGVLCADGVSLAAFNAAAAELAQVPGRMEFFRVAGRPAVVVDYAHTPDAVAQVLATLRPRVRGRVVCVIGCGGDRDVGKRPLMAAAAERGADVIWLTSDNPRSEAPGAIIADMRTGLSGRARVHEEADRHAAIAGALAEAGAEDLVLVAGKGHEEYQEIGGVRRPFSDRAVVAELLREAR
jgi:UDP-N-acetylmuramoyl-L-alanyl-D-glutamate--2,6-diaminopimelate ligase